jgi:hypothetical protein
MLIVETHRLHGNTANHTSHFVYIERPDVIVLTETRVENETLVGGECSEDMISFSTALVEDGQVG